MNAPQSPLPTNKQSHTLEVFLTFLKLGCTSFGGPIAHIGYFRKEFIERKQWLSENQFGQLLAISQFLPGPASSQLGFSIGLVRSGWLGAIMAFLAFTLPSAILLILFASLLPCFSGPIGNSAIHGLKIVAFAVVADAVIGMGRNLCTSLNLKLIAFIAAATIMIAGSAMTQLIVICFGAIAGIWFCKDTKPSTTNHMNELTLNYGSRAGLILISLFILLLLALPLLNGSDPASGNYSAFVYLAQTFYNSGALVFGGGHVVLPFLEESLVHTSQISSEQFLAGYGASQAIPGPMFSFSAYLGAVLPSNQGQGDIFNTVTNATTALTFIFLPGFLLMAGILPLWKRVANKALAVRSIAGINAAVVGLLAAALYDPIFTSAIHSIYDIVIGLVAFALLFFWKRSPLIVVAWCVLASITFSVLI